MIRLTLLLLAASTAIAGPFESTTKGRIVLNCDGAKVSEHTVETEAIASAINYAVSHAGKAACQLSYPSKVLAIDLASLPAQVSCATQPANETRPGTCPSGTTSSWSQTRAYVSAAYPVCWTAGEWLPSTPPTGGCQLPPGIATLQWSVPTQNTDGTALTDLAGFRISYGPSATTMPYTVQVADPKAAGYQLTNLAPATYYFAVRAYKVNGVESAASNVAMKVVR